MNKKNNWLSTELLYLALAPFLVLLGVLMYGILFDEWNKDIPVILKLSGITYLVILVLRILRWIINLLSR